MFWFLKVGNLPSDRLFPIYEAAFSKVKVLGKPFWSLR